MPIRETNDDVDGSTRKTEVLRMSPDQAIRNESDPEVRLYPTIGYSIAGVRFGVFKFRGGFRGRPEPRLAND